MKNCSKALHAMLFVLVMMFNCTVFAINPLPNDDEDVVVQVPQPRNPEQIRGTTLRGRLTAHQEWVCRCLSYGVLATGTFTGIFIAGYLMRVNNVTLSFIE
jgi:hypothetical protein